MTKSITKTFDVEFNVDDVVRVMRETGDLIALGIVANLAAERLSSLNAEQLSALAMFDSAKIGTALIAAGRKIGGTV